MSEESMKCVKPALLLTLLAATVAPPSLALESDSKQPIYIEADSATHDDAKGETLYIGNVHTTQGSLELYADRMTVYQKAGKTDKIIAYGNPVRIKQTPEPGKPNSHGTGQRADYFPDTGILILLDKALAWQGENIEKSDRVASDRIEYDTRHSLMKAGHPSGRDTRVHVTLPPEEKTKEGE